MYNIYKINNEAQIVNFFTKFIKPLLTQQLTKLSYLFTASGDFLPRRHRSSIYRLVFTVFAQF